MNMQDALDLPFEKFLLISWRKNISAYSKNFHIPKFLVVEEIKLFCYVHKILLLLIFYLKIPTLDTSSLKKEIKTLRNILRVPISIPSQNSESKTKPSHKKLIQNSFPIYIPFLKISILRIVKERPDPRVKNNNNEKKERKKTL